MEPKIDIRISVFGVRITIGEPRLREGLLKAFPRWLMPEDVDEAFGVLRRAIMRRQARDGAVR